MERLDKRLANTGTWSRKEARELIRAGRVAADGTVCRAPEQKVPETAAVSKGENLFPRVDTEKALEELMLNKPAGVVSSTDEPGERTVMDLLGPEWRNRGLFPVGRLDKDTEGLLLITDDGPLAHRLLAPKRHVDKVYYVEVDGVLDQGDAEAVRAGIVLGDGTACRPGELELLSGSAARITIHEGKYHQVKRMLASRGKPVRCLRRERFGPLILDPDLPKGGWRALTEEEIQALFRQ